MAFKVNYGFQKAERDRAKQAKKDAKRRDKEAATAKDETSPVDEVDTNSAVSGDEAAS